MEIREIYSHLKENFVKTACNLVYSCVRWFHDIFVKKIMRVCNFFQFPHCCGMLLWRKKMNENDLKKCTEFRCAISWDIFNLSQQQNHRIYVKTILNYLKSPKWITWKISGKVDIDIPFRLIEKCLRGLNSCHISLTESSNTTPISKRKNGKHFA